MEKTLLQKFMENAEYVVAFECIEQAVWLDMCGVPLKVHFSKQLKKIHAKATTWPYNSKLFGKKVSEIDEALFKDKNKDIRLFAEILKQAKDNALSIRFVSTHLAERQHHLTLKQSLFGLQVVVEDDLEGLIQRQEIYLNLLITREQDFISRLNKLLKKHNP